MNSGPLIGDWARFFLVHAVEVAVMAVALAGLWCWSRTGAWQRTLWRAGLVGVILLTFWELAGGGIFLGALASRRNTAVETRAVIMSNLTPSIPSPDRAPEPVAGPKATVAARNPGGVWWPVWGWLIGTMFLLGRAAFGRAIFAFGVRARRRECDAVTISRVAQLSAMISGRRTNRPVDVFELEELAAPVSFGVMKPGIALPLRFGSSHPPRTRDAVLLHELAHIQSHDAFWHALADVVVALLWWHPAVWWMRRRLHLASELAADEATAKLPHGPEALAESLVQLARQLIGTHGAGLQGVLGSQFRSSVGQRVERLLSLEPSVVSRVSIAGRALRLAGIVLTIGAIGLGSACLFHRGTFGRASVGESWNASLGRLLLSSLRAAEAANPIAGISWEVWSREAVAEAQAAGRPVVVEFRADWSVTSVANRRTALEDDTVQRRMIELNVLSLVADWTTPTNNAIDLELNVHGRQGVPLTLVFPGRAGARPEILPDILRPADVLLALSRAVAAASGKEVDLPAAPVDASPGSALVTQVSTLLFEARSLYLSGLYTEARAKLESILKNDPGNGAALHYLGMIENVRPGSSSSNEALAAMESRIDSIVIDSFGGTMTLRDAATMLMQASFAADPAGQGIPVTVHAGLSPEHNLSDVRVRIVPALRRVSVRDAIRAIVENGSRPIAYWVNSYGIVFQDARIAEPPAVLTRAIRIDPERVSRALADLLRQNAAIAPGANPPSADVLAYNLRTHFRTRGIDFQDDRPMTGGPGRGGEKPRRALIFREQGKTLLVRATEKELEVISEELAVLNSPPAQVVVEATLCEISAEAWPNLGLDTLVTGMVDRAEAIARLAGTNANARPIVLTQSQSAAVKRALTRQKGVSVLAAPRLITLSGRQGQIKIVDVRSVVTHLDTATNRPNMAARGEDDSQGTPFAEPFESGPVIDVIPTVRRDGVTIDLTSIVTVKDFVGYDLEAQARWMDSPATPRSLTDPTALPPVIGRDLDKSGSTALPAAPIAQGQPVPVFRQRQIVTRGTLWDGQTAMLVGGEDKLEVLRSRTVPMVGDLPLIGRLFQAQHLEQKKARLLVLVTVRIVDPAGRVVRDDADLPSGIPPQSGTGQN